MYEKHWIVVCDETNNTLTDIEQNRLNVSITFKEDEQFISFREHFMKWIEDIRRTNE